MGGGNGGVGKKSLQEQHKGHMDKTKGEGGGEWWGVNADNCT